jgi:MYXO-CTERM domain-containing protein
LQSSGGCSLSGPAGEAGTAAAMFGIGLASLAWGRRRRR